MADIAPTNGVGPDDSPPPSERELAGRRSESVAPVYSAGDADRDVALDVVAYLAADMAALLAQDDMGRAATDPSTGAFVDLALRPGTVQRLVLRARDLDRVVRALRAGTGGPPTRRSIAVGVVSQDPPRALVDGERAEGLRVFLADHAIERDGVRSRLSWTEWKLLEFLWTHPNTAFSRQALAAAIWREADGYRVAHIEMYISRLRRRVEREPLRPRLIHTVRGHGYRLSRNVD